MNNYHKSVFNNLIVGKAGGTSTATKDDDTLLARIIAGDSNRRVFILSAPGKRNPSDTKVTDALITYASNDYGEDEIVRRFVDKFPDSENRVRTALQERRNLQTELPTLAYLDAMKALGEELNAREFARAYGFEYADPHELLVVSGDFGNARILPESQALIQKQLSDPAKVYIVPGFFGYTKEGKVATLSRGGSDTTAAYIAAALRAAVYENFTDGPILAADPRIVDNPKKIEEITFWELRDLSYSGFSIFHSEAVVPVQRERVPVHVRSTKQYPESGTFVVSDRITDSSRPIIGVAYRNGFTSLNITKSGLNDITGVLGDLAELLKEEGIGVELAPCGIDDISFVIPQDAVDDTGRLHDIITKLYGHIGHEGASITTSDNLGNLVVAGKGIKSNPSISPRVYLALVEAGIPVVYQSQGSLQRCIIYGISNNDRERAVNTVYDRFVR